MSTAASVMTRNVVTIPETTSIKEYLQLIQESSFSGCPVIDKGGLASGFLAQSDVLRALTAMLSSGKYQLEGKQKRQLMVALLLQGKPVADESLMERFLATPVSEIMSKGVYSCHAQTPIVEVCETMTRLRIHRMIVVDEFGKVAGIISSLDALRFCSRELRRDEEPALKNLTAINEPQEKEESD